MSVALLLPGSSAFPQGGSTPPKGAGVYSTALFASIAEMEKSWGHIDDSISGERVRTDYHHMLVEENPEVTDSLPSQFGDYQVEYLDNQALIARYKKLRKQFPVLEIHPAQIKGAELEVIVSVSYVEYRKRKLMFGVSEWSDVKFRFDCQKQIYVVTATVLGGI